VIASNYVRLPRNPKTIHLNFVKRTNYNILFRMIINDSCLPIGCIVQLTYYIIETAIPDKNSAGHI